MVLNGIVMNGRNSLFKENYRLRQISSTSFNLERPAALPEISENSKALIADFNSGDDIILDLVLGKFKPTGKLPVELPSSMDGISKKEDVPYDSKNMLYPFGFGRSYN